MDRPAGILLAEAIPPGGVWLYLAGEADELVAECGRCGDWWYIGEDDSLDAATDCPECRRRDPRTVHLYRELA